MSAWRRHQRAIPPDEGPAIQFTFADGHVELIEAATSYHAEGDELVVERHGEVVRRISRSDVVIVRTIGAVSA